MLSSIAVICLTLLGSAVCSPRIFTNGAAANIIHAHEDVPSDFHIFDNFTALAGLLHAPGKPALHFAVIKGDFLQTKLLCTSNVIDIEATDSVNGTALFYASFLGRLSLVKLLVAAGASINHQALGGITPLTAAILRGNAQTAEFLYSHRAELATDPHEREVLLSAASCQDLQGVVLAIVKSGTDINAKDGSLWTPLHYAASCGRLRIVRILVKHNAGLDLQNSVGNSPLHEALYALREDVARYLVDSGARLQVVNSFGVTPLTLAAERRLKF